MKLHNSLTVAGKDWKVLRKKRTLMGLIVGFPIVLTIVFSLIVQNNIAQMGSISSQYALGLQSLTFVYVILAAVLPTSIASYGIAGEKIEKSLEPLLATPVTDGEILFGKAIAAFTPPITATLASGIAFMIISDILLYPGLGFYYFPNGIIAIMLFLLIPLAGWLGIEVATIASSRTGDVRSANQIAGLMYLPFLALFFAGVTGNFPFDTINLLIVSGILFILVIAMFYLSTSTFQREEILTKWK